MTNDERAAFAVKYGLPLWAVPGDDEDDAERKARRLAERVRAFATKYGLRTCDVPDSEQFHEAVQGE